MFRLLVYAICLSFSKEKVATPIRHLTVHSSRPPAAAAELRALGLKGVTASPIRCIRKSRCLCQQCHYQKMELVLQAIPNKETCAFLTQMQSPQYREMEYVHLGGLSRGITA